MKNEPSLATNNAINELAMAGMLGALGLVAVGGVALAASRRRRQPERRAVAYEPTVASETVARTAEPIPAPAPTAAAAAVVAPLVGVRALAALRLARTAIRSLCLLSSPKPLKSATRCSRNWSMRSPTGPIPSPRPEPVRVVPS